MGIVKNMKIRSLPSLPPINFKLYRRIDIMSTNNKKIDLKAIILNFSSPPEKNSKQFRIKLLIKINLKLLLGILRYFKS